MLNALMIAVCLPSHFVRLPPYKLTGISISVSGLVKT